MPAPIARKILEFDALGTIRENHANARIVHCHGVFDVIHAGHLAYFEAARKLGDLLVVTITSDEHVNKGPGRPYFGRQVRARMVAALEIVDFVAISPYPTAVPAIERIRPTLYVKGPDYRVRESDPTGGIYKEERAVQGVGGQLVFTDDATHSASTLINRFFSSWTEDQQKSIEAVKTAGGLTEIEAALERVSKEKVCIVGEPIVDTYVFCQPEAISSKSPSVSAKFLYEENYAGGALAIANHLADFAKETCLVTTHGDEPYFRELLGARMDARVRVEALRLPNVPTPRKTRYIAPEKSQRIFEITNLASDQWRNHPPQPFVDLFRKETGRADLTILADFGHGLFEEAVLGAATELPGFIGLNVQTNSSNLGFNPYTKHKRFSFLSIDTKEVRLAYHDRYAAPLELARRLQRDLAPMGASAAMTLGPNGAVFFPNRAGLPPSAEFSAPAFSDNVLDATGAGDAFFCLAASLTKVGCPDVMIPFVANVFAGLKTRIIGNKSSVTRAQLIKAITALLR